MTRLFHSSFAHPTVPFVALGCSSTTGGPGRDAAYGTAVDGMVRS